MNKSKTLSFAEDNKTCYGDVIYIISVYQISCLEQYNS